MRLSRCWLWVAFVATVLSTQGIVDLVARRMPNHVDFFEFQLIGNKTVPAYSASKANDEYMVSSTTDGKILVEGNSLSALASGLHRYLTDVVHVDIWWFIGSQLDIANETLPILATPLNGFSIVPWRYHFDTVTFSYTTAFWSWDDWELELDWLALHGVNLPLAWVGFEKTLVDVYREISLTDTEILSYFSGPAFQSWNRFGNIQESWGGELPLEWIDDQFELQKNITQRMVDLGMTPVLPSFTGFVPNAISRVLPDAELAQSTSEWNSFSAPYSNVTFLEPTDPNFAMLQKSFISKQTAAYGNITHVYTLDQFNENTPSSGAMDYLRNVSYSTWQSLKAADPEAVWMMQGWLFYSLSSFWTDDKIEAYLSGVKVDSDMIILDLVSETAPQWQKTNSYYGKPWIWCQLHDFGGNNGLYGQVQNITINPIEALANSSNLIGFGLTPEGQEGNEIVYDLLLDQAWSASPINTETYFANWVSRRYSGNGEIPPETYAAWEILRATVYNNTNSSFLGVTKSILELSPNVTNMLDLPGHHGATSKQLSYNPADLVSAWDLLFNASKTNSDLWNNPGYAHDITDVTRQVLANNFTDNYLSLISTYTSPNASNTTLTSLSANLTSLLTTLDTLLSALPAFSLSTWLASAHARTSNTTLQSFYDYEARNQITLWGPDGEISDYACRQWGGLVGGYYKPRWEVFTSYLVETPMEAYNDTELKRRLRSFEEGWQVAGGNGTVVVSQVEQGGLEAVIGGVVGSWGEVFGL
ncbi:putative alpha-N-acetylglucosaminidase [Mollisia scopiformis]|uniref:Putative alpha-N-acetylglucosaminidase n=1 Tax=Mollisia scopiformis TaxID=149040 RepID=A0A194XD62_MOLSC|nr:putative alpha-N-acetylglucosaminidase [Mollisia scopiformis]KUJ18115.1 putative alpha-N-acetylglucosaminidase [Mollisia scopiformis]